MELRQPSGEDPEAKKHEVLVPRELRQEAGSLRVLAPVHDRQFLLMYGVLITETKENNDNSGQRRYDCSWSPLRPYKTKGKPTLTMPNDDSKMLIGVGSWPLQKKINKRR